MRVVYPTNENQRLASSAWQLRKIAVQHGSALLAAEISEPCITTGAIEFSRKMERVKIETELQKTPFLPQYIAHRW